MSDAGTATSGGADAVVNLGARLREVRTAAGLSLREVARQLGVSPSFISQMETGKSQPSVATLYSLAQLLGVSVDVLFEAPATGTDLPGAPVTAVTSPTAPAPSGLAASGLPAEPSSPKSVTVISPESRPRIVLESGVVWEQLAHTLGEDLDFMEVRYPAGSSSTSNGQRITHAGMEYGYVMTGELQIVSGDEVVTVRAGESITLDSSVPHRISNLGDVDARGIWCNHHGSRMHE